MHTKNYIFSLDYSVIKNYSNVVEFQCCTFSICYVDMALNVPVKILYNTHCYDQNIDPVVLKHVRVKIFLR